MATPATAKRKEGTDDIASSEATGISNDSKRLKTEESDDEELVPAVVAADEVVVVAEASPKEEGGTNNDENGQHIHQLNVLESNEPIITPKGFPIHLNPTDPSHFDSFLFQLLAFQAQYKTFQVTRDEYPQLHAWLQFVKKEYKNYVAKDCVSQLTSQQFAVLESLHVPITSRGNDHWNRFYALLGKYKKDHGHVLVPRLCEVPGLGDWVTDQRRQYKALKQGQATQLSNDRLEKLEALGFVWQVRNRPEWDNRYMELVQYKAENGDCKVPQHYKANRPLGKWVAKQREQYKLMQSGKHSFLTPYRLEKLNAIGFVWQVRTALETEVREVVEQTNSKNNDQAAEDDGKGTELAPLTDSATKAPPVVADTAIPEVGNAPTTAV